MTASVKKTVLVVGLVFLLVTTCFLTSCLSDEISTWFSHGGVPAEPLGDPQYKLAILPSAGVSVRGSGIRTVKKGETAVFYISVDPGYYYIGNTLGATYDPDTGTLTVPDVTRSQTLSVVTATYDEAAILSLYWYGAGSASLTEGSFKDYTSGTRTVKAVPAEGYDFKGWTVNAPLEQGGERVSFSEEYTFELNSHVELYANFALKAAPFSLSIINDTPALGTVTSERTDTNTVSLTASASADGRFLGWSTEKANVSAIFSKEPAISLELTEDTDIYPIYLNKSEYVIVYHMGEGTVGATGGSEYVVRADFKEVFACQQTLSNQGQFVRDGYIAVGYTTSPVSFVDYRDVNEMPGFSNMGGICEVPEDTGCLDLYVVWAEVTDPSDFTVTEDGRITKYRGNATVVVVPEKIGSQTVTSIASGVFAGKAMSRLVLPRTLLAVEDGAFRGCTMLHEVSFFDSLVDVTNNAFADSNNIEVIALHSFALARQKGGEGLFCVKYERIRRQPGKRITVLSGSSSWNGFISSQMQEQFSDYYVINYGTNMENSEGFFLEVIAKYTHPGDIVIHAPEITGGNACGGTNLTFKMFRANCQCYDIFRDVDMRRYSNFWKAYSDFVKPGAVSGNCPNPTSEFQVDGGAITPHGDMAKLKTGPTNFSCGNVSLTGTPQIVVQKDNLNQRNVWIRAKGGILLESFGTVDENCIQASQKTQAVYDAYTKKCADALNYPVISSVGSYIMLHSEMGDSQWHCNATGAAVRTARLTEDLKRFFTGT